MFPRTGAWLLTISSFTVFGVHASADQRCSGGVCRTRTQGTHLMQRRWSASVVRDDPMADLVRPPLCDDLPEATCNESVLCEWGADLSRCHAKIAWFHVMKTGGSFGTTLAHYANSSLPKQAHIPGDINLSDPEDINVPPPPGMRELQGEANFFGYKYPVDTWFKDVFWYYGEPENCSEGCNPGNHKGISNQSWSEWQGRFFGMFRQPEERIVSSFNHFANGTGDIVSYSRRLWGAQTKMLAGADKQAAVLCEFKPDEMKELGYTCNEGGADNDILARNVSLAVERLKTGFAFVGLTEQWDLSVCLFHRMFGGECLPVEFGNMRPHSPDSDESKNLLLEAVKADPDPWDNQVYAAASEVFWTNVARFGVSRSTCQASCAEVAYVRTASRIGGERCGFVSEDR